jgi:hypothetical protein
MLCRREAGQMRADADEAARRFTALGIMLPVIPLLRGLAHILSDDTVKSQTGSIYRKLGVSTRSQAVTRARQLGLLDG